jgi:hypothetical protein
LCFFSLRDLDGVSSDCTGWVHFSGLGKGRRAFCFLLVIKATILNIQRSFVRSKDFDALQQESKVAINLEERSGFANALPT